MKKIGVIELSNKIYQVYKNNSGYLELYRSTGVIERKDHSVWADNIKRHVTNVTEMKDLTGWFKKKDRKKPYNPYNDENQLEII